MQMIPGIDISSRMLAIEKIAQSERHTVAKNDTLTGIARARGTTVGAIIARNPVLRSNPNRLRIGQILNLPPAVSAPARRPSAPARAAAAPASPKVQKPKPKAKIDPKAEALRLADFQSRHDTPYPITKVVNNPGNLRPPRKKPLWRGELDYEGRKPDVGFARFDTPQHGLRAMMSNLRNIRPLSYAELHDGYDMVPEADMWKYHTSPAFSTLNNIIPRYAPRSENDTAGHISNTSKVSGIDPDARLDFGDDKQMVNLARGIVDSESGRQAMNWFTPEEYLNAVKSSRVNL